MLEKNLESKIVKIAKELGYLTYKFSSPSHKGVPDRIFINPNGFIFFIEFKSTKGKLTTLQKKTKKTLEDNCVKVFLIKTVEEGTKILKLNNYV